MTMALPVVSPGNVPRDRVLLANSGGFVVDRDDYQRGHVYQTDQENDARPPDDE